MIRYLIRRIIWAVVLFFAVTVVSYVLFFVIPADPAKQACGQSCTQGDVSHVRHFLGLDKPVYWQYGQFGGRLPPASLRRREKAGALAVQWDRHRERPVLLPVPEEE